MLGERGRTVPPAYVRSLSGPALLLPLLAFLAEASVLEASGLVAGLGYALILTALLIRGVDGASLPGRPADWVTLVRAVLTGGVAGLVAQSFSGPIQIAELTVLASVAIALDGVDGWVARHSGTASAAGARFDMEVDAVLLLLLSVYVAHTTGTWWALAIGAARYVFATARFFVTALQGSASPRYWRKIVAAIQVIVLTVVASGSIPPPIATSVLAIAIALLVESFAQEAWEVHRLRSRPVTEPPLLSEPGAVLCDV
jgi:phosphatidylglycerophosphate synthase